MQRSPPMMKPHAVLNRAGAVTVRRVPALRELRSVADPNELSIITVTDSEEEAALDLITEYEIDWTQIRSAYAFFTIRYGRTMLW